MSIGLNRIDQNTFSEVIITQKTEAIVFKLSLDVFNHIFLYLDPRSITRFAKTCRYARGLTKNAELWRALLDRDFGWEPNYSLEKEEFEISYKINFSLSIIKFDTSCSHRAEKRDSPPLKNRMIFWIN